MLPIINLIQYFYTLSIERFPTRANEVLKCFAHKYWYKFKNLQNYQRRVWLHKQPHSQLGDLDSAVSPLWGASTAKTQKSLLEARTLHF